MSTLTKDPAIAAMFMLAREHEGTEIYPQISMPKLDGLRAMWIPGRGWWSRRGVQYAPSVTAHLKEPNSSVPVDGEFYAPGWSLQRINAAAGVNLDQPVEDTKSVLFCAFDIVSKAPALMRMQSLHQTGCWVINWCVVYDARFAQKAFDVYCDEKLEGQMLKTPHMPYVRGRTPHLLKRKAWKLAFGTVIAVKEGQRSLAGHLGGVTIRLASNVEYECGLSEGLSDARRLELWRDPSKVIGKTVEIRYRELSDDGKPLTSTFRILP